MNDIVRKSSFPGLDGTGCRILIPRRQDGALRSYQDTKACGLLQNKSFRILTESFSDNLEKCMTYQSVSACPPLVPPTLLL